MILNDEKKQAFSEMLCRAAAVDILLHDHPTPDPDSMASALGLEKLIRDKFDKPVMIWGVPPNQTQNRLMVSELDITLHDPRKWAGYSRNPTCVLVDCNAKAGSLTLCDTANTPKENVWTIDHHCDKDSPVGSNVDMHAVGSASTIITEYLQSFDITFSSESRKDEGVATALMLGLMTDTENLLRDNVDATRDIPAFLYLKEHYDPHLYHKLMRYDFPAYFYDCLRISDSSKIISEPFGIYNLGFLKEERAGVISQIADLWMRRERLHIVVVYAIVGKELWASVRTKNGGGKASEIARALFPDCGAGGGDHAAGASMRFNSFIDVDMLDEDSKQELLHITTKVLVARAKKIADLDE